MDDYPLPLEDLNHMLLLSPHSRPSVRDSGPTPDLTSLLSASSYPLPESFSARREDASDKDHLYGGIILDMPQSEVHTPQPPQRKPKRPSTAVQRAAESSAKKRGRPRKSTDGPHEEDPEERRRMQIRLAQRAYRSRKEASLSRYQTRISQLETAVEKMSASVLSFSDHLVLSGALASYPDLTSHLRDTVETCLTLTKDTTPDDEQGPSDITPPMEESLSQPSGHQNDPSMSLTVALSPSRHTQPKPTNTPQPSLHQDASFIFESTEISAVELSAFIERLHVACIYQGFHTLRDPSISLRRLQRPFRLLLAIMDRERVTSYFEAALNARMTQRRLDDWKDVPFFRLGGAGSHYRSPSLRHYHRWPMVHDLSQFSPETQEAMKGDWFDLQDLEGFLQERGVHLLATPPVESNRGSSSAQLAINVSRFIQGLISRCVCLGRTPGFRRHDVERALRAAVWT